MPRTNVPRLNNLYPDLTSMPDNLVTTQKKLSFACEKTMDPAPIMSATNTLSISDWNPSEPINGSMMDDVVIIATVDDPCAVFIAAASRNGSQILILILLSTDPSIPAIPESCNTFPNIPPAPVIRMMDAVSLSAFPV